MSASPCRPQSPLGQNYCASFNYLISSAKSLAHRKHSAVLVEWAEPGKGLRCMKDTWSKPKVMGGGSEPWRY